MNRKWTDMLIALLAICLLALGGMLVVRYASHDLAGLAREKIAAVLHEIEARRALPPVTITPDESPPMEMPPPELPVPPRDMSPYRPVPPGAIPPRPLTPMFHWISSDDYPPAALRNGWSGGVVARWTIHQDGSVSNCRIVRGSGHDVLDATTCALIMDRARFAPARDAAGNAINSEMQMAWRWQLPDNQPDFFDR